MPIGDSFESLCSAGLASAEPTIWNFCDLPDFWSLTWTTAPTSTCSVSMCFSSITVARRSLLLELGDPLLEHRLLVLGVVVFGVLGDVAELAGLLDPLGDLPPLVVLEVLELFLELLEPIWGDQSLASHSVCTPSRPDLTGQMLGNLTKNEPAVGANRRQTHPGERGIIATPPGGSKKL